MLDVATDGAGILIHLTITLVHSRLAEAEALRTKHREATSAVSDIERQIRELEQNMAKDYGPDSRFEPLSRQCYISELGGEWNYEICPYKNAAQKDKNGGSTSIGNWEGFEDDYMTLKFTNGQHCWNGPQRSLTVSLVCGEDSKVSRAPFSPPARCGAERPSAYTHTTHIA